ncbi:RloB domain-containing protein [Crocosphaera watsonii WH 8501]|uniref:RloB domain-containing protein n=1 Tax=Crocosphaera watsonii TaxID=263511 RepID=UPI00067854B6
MWRRRNRKNYFECFRVPRKVIKVKGLNKDPDILVNKTIEYKKEDDYDQVWCVFDKDNFQNFNSTINRVC